MRRPGTSLWAQGLQDRPLNNAFWAFEHGLCPKNLSLSRTMLCGGVDVEKERRHAGEEMLDLAGFLAFGTAENCSSRDLSFLSHFVRGFEFLTILQTCHTLRI
jgi:hypothetical protein